MIDLDNLFLTDNDHVDVELEKIFANWVIDYFIRLKGKKFVDTEKKTEYSDEFWYEVNSARYFRPYDEYGRIIVGGTWMFLTKVDWELVLFNHPINVPAGNIFEVDLYLYIIDMNPTTKGLQVKITGIPTIAYEDFQFNIHNQWVVDTEFKDHYREINPHPTFQSELERQIENAVKLLVGDDRDDIKKVIVKDWWLGKTASETSIFLKNKGLANLSEATIYNIRSQLGKKYDAKITPPKSMNHPNSRFKQGRKQ